MIKWLEVPTKNALDKFDSIEVKGSEIIEQLELSNDYYIRFSPNKDLTLSYNIKDFIHPLGKLGRIMYEEKNYKGLRSSLQMYWGYKGEPTVSFDVAKAIGEDGTGCVTLRNKLLKTDEENISVRSFMSRIPLDVISPKLDRLIVGGEGDHIELQFLAQSCRKEVSKGDFIDPGIFVKLNGKIEVSPGISRLVCTNGLIEQMNMWENASLDFLSDREMFTRALTMSDWLISKSGHKVNSVREISAALGDTYRKSLLNRYWRSWSERIELKELDWYTVIADLTSFANRSLSNERYELLEIPALITKIEKEGHCPTCSAEVK